MIVCVCVWARFLSSGQRWSSHPAALNTATCDSGQKPSWTPCDAATGDRESRGCVDDVGPTCIFHYFSNSRCLKDVRMSIDLPFLWGK